MPSLDLELLPVLIAFHESKNLIEAAEKLRISQPAVTQRLQRLQEQVPHPLFAFEGRKKVLTHYGRAFYETAKENISKLNVQLENLNQKYSTSDKLVLRVGGQRELIRYFSEVLKFNGRLEHRQQSESEAIMSLHDETIDVALSSSVVDTTELMSRKFFESSSHLIFHQKWHKTLDSIEHLKDHKDILLKVPCALHTNEKKITEKFCHGMKISSDQLNCKAAYDDWYSILNFVESGEGIAIVPGFIQSSLKEVHEFRIPHSMIQRSVYYAVFQRKLRKIESYKKILNFVISDS
jgi:DNA-binding transcriptional LysR family regulator